MSSSVTLQTSKAADRSSDLGALPVWDLSEMYAGYDDPKIDEDLNILDKTIKSFKLDFEGKIALLDGAALATAISRYEDICERIETLYTFSGLLKAQNSLAPEIQALYARTSEALSRLGAHLVFFDLEINDLEDQRLDCLFAASLELKHYQPWIKDLRRFKPYQLNKAVEEYEAETHVTGSAAWVRLFHETQARMRYHINGEDVSLAIALNELEDHNSERRKAAGLEIARVQSQALPLSSYIVNTLLLDKQISDRLRGYKTPIASRNISNKLEGEVVSALVEAVRGSYGRISHRYYALKAKWLAGDTKTPTQDVKLNWWDRSAPIPGTPERLYHWSEARDIVLSSWQDFHPHMSDLAKPFFEKGWIDAPVTSGKDSGAFSCSGPTKLHPYILLNYQGKAGDIGTLAHELGHGVHQTLGRIHGPLMCNASLPLAETASVFGEMLTFQALLRHTTDPLERRALIASKVQDMIGTVVRQISFHSYEERLHDVRMGGELTPEDISKIWMSIQSESLGPAIKFDTAYESMWAYIPHFIHTPFYVYAYAFGDCLVNALYMKYQESGAGFAEQYFELLRDSSIKSHTELLKPFGLDARDPEFWQMGLRVIENLIDELDV